ncbi:hypothetical protein CU098_007279, partial [Rhizopus stolonifer]
CWKPSILEIVLSDTNINVGTESCYSYETEYWRIEFKSEVANTSLLKHQQSRIVRINGTILDDVTLLTKD